jgi:hypothetical protein
LRFDPTRRAAEVGDRFLSSRKSLKQKIVF